MPQIPCAGGAFGSGGLGAVPFGARSLGGILRSEAVDPNRVRVYTVPISAADALSPFSWESDPVTAGLDRAVVSVAEEVSQTQWLLTYEAPLSPGVEYVITYVGEAPMQPGCNTTTFTALDVPPVPQVRRRARLGAWDIANPNLLRDAAIIDPPPLGTYQVTDTGDVASDTRLQSLRKRILRRVFTAAGGFFHLPGYGAERGIKSLVRSGSLLAWAADLRSQVQREPEVVTCQVNVTRLAPNAVRVLVRVGTIYGLDVVADQVIDVSQGG